jgi:hypothetical protein
VPADLISWFTFSVAFAAAARACSLRVSIFPCASFAAAATASSAFLAWTDKSASCWESSDTAVRNWTAVRAKVAADIDRLKAGAAGAKHDLDTRQAEHHAERLEWEAGVAIDYAIASIEQAKLAVLDAVSSRAEAERSKAS